MIKDSENYLWVKLTNLYTYPVLLCCTYIPPINSPYFDKNIFHNIESDIYILQFERYGKNYTMLIGDFNARTGLLNDLEHDGNRYTDTEYINSQISRTRRNFDGLINFSGQKLIELCKTNNLYILNGRKEGDTLGRFTYYNTKQAPSTIDYAIASYDLFQKISHFIVKLESYLSDHCQIVTWFEIDKQNKDNSQWKNDLFQLPKSFKFEKTNKNIFLQKLASSKIQTKITSFLQHSYTLTKKGMQEANKNFSEIILQAAKYSLKTVSRKKNKKINEYQEKVVQ